MARPSLQPILCYLRTRFGFAKASAETDGRLLRHFADGRDEAAFEALLRRHGPLVWGACRRVLASDHDAEDAFQATFLVLVRKAASIRKQSSLSSWLYGVAHRIALKARADARRRRGSELGDVAAPRADVLTETSAREVRAILDEEVLQLPERLRVPVVLCCLEGRTKAEAARQLGWKEGTLASRLARARQRLRARLERRGVVLSSGSFGLLLAENATAVVPMSAAAAALRMAALCAAGETPLAGLVSSPVAALAQGVLQTMTVTRLKMAVTLAVALCALAAGAGWAAHQVLVAVKPDEAQRKDEPKTTTTVVFPPRPPTDTQVRTDYYGDPLPLGALVRLGTIQLRHRSAHLVFSADGKTLISGGSDFVVRFWDLASGKLARHKQLGGPQFPKSEPGPSFEGLSPDGKVLVAMRAEWVYLYDTGSGEELKSLRTGRTSHHRFVFSPDSKILATATSLGGHHVIRLWDVATGKERMVQEQEHPFMDLAFSADGKLLASVDGAIRLWDTATGQELRNVPTEGKWPAFSLAYSPNGKTVAAGSRDGTVTLWEAATLKKQETLKPFAGSSNCCQMTFSPDSALLVIGGDKDLVFWDVATHKELRRLPEREVCYLAFARDGKTLACAGKSEIHLWDVTTGERLHHRPGHGDDVHSVAVSPDGKVVASSGWDDPTIRLWDAATGKPLPLSLRHSYSVRSCAFSTDGKLLVGGSLGGDGTLCLWAADTGEEVRRFVIKDLSGGPERHEVLVCHLSADGRRLAAISWTWVKMRESCQLTVLDTRTGEIVACRPFPQSLSSRFTPDGEGVTVDSSERLIIEETTTGRERATIPGDLGHPVAFSPDGKLIAVGIHKTELISPLGGRASWQTKGVRLAEVATGQEVFHVDGSIDFVAFSRDGRVLATADPEALCLWDAATGEPLFRRPWPEGLVTGRLRTPVQSLGFLPDGRAMVTGMADGTALVWDLAPQSWPTPKVAPDLGRKELDALWADLVGDASKAYRAVRALTTVPAQAARFLKQHLRPIAVADPKHVERLLADLDSDQFEARKTATEELAKLGERIEPALRKALERQPSLEVRRRVTMVLDAIGAAPPAEALRTHRSIQALEGIGTVEARRVLQQLATGAPAARETREAKEALERLTATTR